MKRIAIAIVISLIFLALSVAPASATTWHTNRDDITTITGHANTSYNHWWNATTGNTTYFFNMSLPCDLENFTAASSMFRIKQNWVFDVNTSFNLSVNQNTINDTSSLTWLTGNWSNVTFTILLATLNGTDRYINITWDHNGSANVGLILVGSYINLSTWLASSGVITIKEKDVTSPTVGRSSTRSFFTVNNSMNITSDVWINLTSVVLNVTFPGSTVTDSLSNFTNTTLLNNGSNLQYTQYQKRGPYVYSVDEEVSGSTHTVTVRLKSREALRNVVDWTVTTSLDVYQGYLDTLNYNTLTVTLNGVDQDWEQGSIVLEDFTAQVSPVNNRWIFTWTVAPAVEAPVGALEGALDAIEEALTGSTWGVPNALWILIIVAIIIVAIYYIYYYKKK